MAKRTPKPYLQGQLDYLCGAYSVVNAVFALHGPWSTVEARVVLLETLQILQITNDSLTRLANGTPNSDMRQLIPRICSRYQLQSGRLLYGRQKHSLSHLWQSCRTFIDERGGVLIVRLEHRSWSHWTVITRVSAKQLYLFDSTGLQAVKRSHCTIGEISKQRPYRIDTTAIHCLWHR